MAALIPNISKGKWAQFGSLPNAGDKLQWVLFQGAETDANVRHAASLQALIATAVDEATFTGYSRHDATGVTVTVDNTADHVTITAANPQWSPTTVQALTRIALVYNPGGASPDANIIPLFVDDFVLSTPTSGTVTYQVAAGGCAVAA